MSSSTHLRLSLVDPEDPDETLEFTLDGATAFVGRNDSCDIVLDAEVVSGRHGVFERGADGGYTYCDLSSTNGSALRREGVLEALAPAMPAPIRAGDVILLASAEEAIEITVTEGAAAYAATADMSRTVLATAPLTDLLNAPPDGLMHLVASASATDELPDMAQAAADFARALLGVETDDVTAIVVATGANARAGRAPETLEAQLRDQRRVRLVRDDEAKGLAVLAPLWSGDTWHGGIVIRSVQEGRRTSEGLDTLAVAAAFLGLRVGQWAQSSRHDASVKVLKEALAKASGDTITPIGDAPQFRRAVELAKNIATSDISVLLHGETGAGKEVLARWIHSHSTRRDKPFIAVNCAAIPDTLMEGELFGHARGAFTGAQRDRAGLLENADGGTLFLDEIGDMGLPMQAKFLRVLEDGQLRRLGESRLRSVDVRIVSASHRDLRAMATEGSFREDLMYRLNAVTIEIPSLRERGDDVVTLAHRLLAQAAAKANKTVPGFTGPAVGALLAYQWPGNVRELKNEIARAVALTASHQAVALNVFSDRVALSGGGLDPGIAASGSGGGTLKEQVESAEKKAVTRALADCSGNVSAAAEQLGLSRAGLYKMLDRLGIKR